MSAVWARARSELNSRWRTTVVLALLVGLVGGAAIAGVAGARRTANAMERFVAYSRPQEIFVFNPEGTVDLDAVTRLPQVADAGEAAYLVGLAGGIVLAAAVGLPLGVGAGRWAWLVVADGIGTPAAAVTPALAIALTVPAVVLVANALAALPARAAGRIRPAVALRAE